MHTNQSQWQTHQKMRLEHLILVQTGQLTWIPSWIIITMELFKKGELGPIFDTFPAQRNQF